MLDVDNPHAMDPDRFHSAFRYYLSATLDVTVLPADVGLAGVCRECGYDDGRAPARYRAETDDAAQYVAVAKVRAAIDAGWDGVTGCWARHRAVRALYAHLRHQGAPTPPPRLWIPSTAATRPQETEPT